MGTGYTDNRVDLRRAGSNASETVLVPEGQWQPTQLAGLNWMSAERLQITVPNRTVADFWVASFHGINIDVRYDHDDPVDRATKWIAWRAENEALLKNSLADPQSKLPQPQPPAVPPVGPSADDDDSKLYSPASLHEVRSFADLPEGVKALANDRYMNAMLDNTPTKFLAGGINETGAIVAYEQFGYVPSFHAQSYVYSHSRWIPAKEWDIPAGVTNLHDLISVMTSSH